jgi:Transposase DDE domain/Domain of unknown function (DUF4372)
MALILLVFKHLPVIWTREGTKAMRHHNSVLHGLLKHIPWPAFDKLVDEHRADAGVRSLSTKSQFVALLYAQLAGAVSLREIETAMQSHSDKLYHLGAAQVQRSTLADANRLRSHEVFSGLFSHMAQMAGRGFKRSTAEAVRLIDSTSIKLSGLTGDWSRYYGDVHGAKAHIVYDPDAEAPLYLSVTASRVNDIVAAKAMPIEPGATYVFDLGYYDFGWWTKLDQLGCRIVTRLKANTPLQHVETRALPATSPLLYDRVGFLPERMKASRKNPFQDPLREIGVLTDTGKALRILTNDLDAPAQEVADLYKRRWAIELFFRWVKQTLKIKHFLGRSENAVRIQIAIALIAYLLLRLAKDAVKIVGGTLAFARLIKANIMHRRDLDQLLKTTTTTTRDPRQLCLNLAQA